MAFNDDGKLSDEIANRKRIETHEEAIEILTPQMFTEQRGLPGNIYHAHNLFGRGEIDIFHRHYRYGISNPYEALTNTREYLFFTKPDLNIHEMNESPDGSTVNPTNLNSALSGIPFWSELKARQPEVLECLQYSYSKLQREKGVKDPFNHLLENMVQSTLDMPGISSDMIETPSNAYGVNYTYHGSAEASDDTFDFTLEFKDTKYLPVYHFFKAYEEYEILKHHGTITPYIQYIEQKILHDQYAIYKFLVGEDGETIIYYAKYYGVKSKNVPRDVFNNTTYDNGISYSIDFNAAFFEDMNPLILTDFNNLNYPLLQLYGPGKGYEITPYNEVLDRADMRPARMAMVVEETNNSNKQYIYGSNEVFATLPNPAVLDYAPGGKAIKLKWRGDDRY